MTSDKRYQSAAGVPSGAFPADKTDPVTSKMTFRITAPPPQPAKDAKGQEEAVPFMLALANDSAGAPQI